MTLALNNLKRVDMPLNKETKPNQPNDPVLLNGAQYHWISEVQTVNLLILLFFSI